MVDGELSRFFRFWLVFIGKIAKQILNVVKAAVLNNNNINFLSLKIHIRLYLSKGKPNEGSEERGFKVNKAIQFTRWSKIFTRY
jgi:hypothetical protein